MSKFEAKRMCALMHKNGNYCKDEYGKVRLWEMSEDYIAESFNMYYLNGEAKIVIVNPAKLQ
mgnify:CR=1 FL=1